MSKSHPVLGGIVLLYFIIALEVLIMISPFAAFFYAAFNPFHVLKAFLASFGFRLRVSLLLSEPGSRGSRNSDELISLGS